MLVISLLSLGVFLFVLIPYIVLDNYRVILVHGIFVLAALPLMWAAIQHFVPVLTRSSGPTRWVRALPWLAMPLGAVLLITLAGALPRHVLLVPAGLLGAGAVAMAGWIWQRSRRALGAPHPGVRWYLAALGCLIAGLGAAIGMVLDPARFSAWYRLHLHLNLFGWIGLTVLGTLPVLLPTCLQKFDRDAAFRLRLMLPWALFGVFALAGGAALKLPVLGGVGALCLLILLLVIGRAWCRDYGLPWHWSGPAISLALGGGFLVVLLLVGLLHGAGVVTLGASPMLAGFVGGFLLPVVLGALAQLLPVWRFPGPDSPRRQALARRLAAGAGRRGLLAMTGGAAALLGWLPGLGATAVAVACLMMLALKPSTAS